MAGHVCQRVWKFFKLVLKLFVFLFLASTIALYHPQRFAQKPHPTVDPPDQGYTNFERCNVCNEQNVYTEINAGSVCSKDENTKIDLLIVVVCGVGNSVARETVRSTWGNFKDQMKGNYRVVFVIGKNDVFKETIQRESDKYGDIVQFNFTDGYRTLSKKVIHIFHWSATFCNNTRHVMKTDTDVFVNVPFLLRFLRFNNLDNSIGGHCEMVFSRPSRDRRNRHFVSMTEYRGSWYPPYCYGGGYVMSLETSFKVYEGLINTPLLTMEDVFIGIAASKGGITLTNIPGFNLEFVPYDFDLFCHCVVLVHKLTLSQLQNIWLQHKLCPLQWDKKSPLPSCVYPGIRNITPLVCICVTIFIVLCLVFKLWDIHTPINRRS